MTLLEWKDEYCLGIPAVDEEHRELIELINELHAELQAGESGITVLDFLGEIYARISAHFALEEKVMREQEYDELADHKADHERLLDELRDLMDACEDRLVSEAELSERLDDWFAVHFRTRDARLHRHLQ